MKKVRWGIVGLGGIAHKFADAIQVVDNAELYAVGSRDLEKAESFKKQYDAKFAYGSYDALFKDENIDAVYIAVPNHLHKTLALKALSSNKAVLLEKPACLNANDLDEVIALAQKRNLFFMEAMKFCFSPAVIKLKSLLDDNILGKIHYISAEKSYYSNPILEKRLYDASMGGGALYDVGVYPIAFFNHIFNQDLLIKDATLTYGSHTVDTTVSIYAKAEHINHIYLGASIESYGPGNFIIGGEKGYIDVKAFSNASKFNIHRDGKIETFEYPHLVNGLEYQIEASSQAILQGDIEHPIMSWSDSNRIAKIVDNLKAQPNHD